MVRGNIALLTLSLVVLSGCRQQTAATVEGSASPASPTAVVHSREVITKEEAIATVKSIALKKAPAGLGVNLDAHTTDDGFRVFVTYESGLDANGNEVTPAIGSHAIYEVSKRGEITRVIRGL